MGISEWVGLLNRFDYGPYVLGRSKTRQNALKKAARLMRKTSKPVGLVVWRGAHAWVMSGFTATADPAHSKDFTVTSVWVQDPWYPQGELDLGTVTATEPRVSVATLGQDYLPYDRPHRRQPDRDGKYMLVLPKLAPRHARRLDASPAGAIASALVRGSQSAATSASSLDSHRSSAPMRASRSRTARRAPRAGSRTPCRGVTRRRPGRSVR